MNGLFGGVFAITVGVVLFGAWLGAHCGGKRILAWLSKWIFSWGAGVALAAYGLRQGWHDPWGLITPIVAGLLTAIFLRMILAWRSKRAKCQARLGFLQRSSGALLGAALGFVIAIAGWQIVLFTCRLTAPTPVVASLDDPLPQQEEVADGKTAWASLAEVAHRGFLQHLPVAGPLTNEVLAVATILKAPAVVRKEFAKHKKWDTLANLPSFQDIVDDEALFEEINAAVAGNLAALYRLQKHPSIIEFYKEEPLQTMITDMRASQIAIELTEFQNRTERQKGTADQRR